MRVFAAFTVASTILIVSFFTYRSFDPVNRQARQQAAYYEAQRQQLALERERLELQQAQQQAVVSAPAYGLLGFLYAALPLVVACVALCVAADAYKQRRTPLVKPDPNGLLPVARVQIEQGQLNEAFAAALAAHHQTRAIAAAHQPIAERVNYTISVKDAPAIAPPATIPALEAAPMMLPTIVDLSDVLGDVKAGHIAYGKLATGELLQLPLSKVYHALYHGDTGSGKTNAIDSMIVQLHHMSTRLPLKLYAGDYKRELAATWNRSPLFMGGIQTEASGIADMLAELARQVRLRYATFERVGNETGRVIRNYADFAEATGERPDLAVCIIDELNAVLEGAASQLASNLKVLLQIGRGAGFFVQGGFQYMTSHVFGRDGSKQFVTRAHFGAYDQTAVSMLFGKVDHKSLQPMLDGTQGRGLIRVVGQAQPTPFQALRCTEDDIIDAVASLTASGKVYRVPSVSPSSAQESPKTLEVGNVVVLPQQVENVSESGAEALTVEVPEVEQVQMIALAKAGVSRAKICSQLYGVSAGRSYDRVKQTLDAAGL